MKQNIFAQLKFVLSCAILVSLWGCGGGGNINTNNLQLVFMTQPSSNSTPTGTNSVVAPAIQVKVLDSKGNLDNSAAIPITLTIGNQPNADLPNGKIYTGYLNGTTTVTSVNGVASFNDISVSQPGVGYTLAANASGVSSATSNPFNVTSSITAAESAGYKSTEAKSGYEVAYTGDIGSNFQGFVYVYIDYGSNPIASDEEFRAFNCGESWVQNTPRNAVFDYANTLGSPDVAAGSLLPYTDCQGHTWGLIVQNISYIWPFESSAYPAPQPVNGWQAGQTGVYVPPAQVKYSSINKNQLILFTKNNKDGNPILRFFVTDQWGNVYIIKSSNAADQTTEQIAARFESAVFPAGWSKSRGYLAQDLYSSPVYNNYGNESYPSAIFMDLRDNVDLGYSMIYWNGGNGGSVAQQAIPTGVLPLVITEAGGRINGTSSNDQMYGSSGNDLFYPYAGDDIIDGGSGYNGVVFELSSSLYVISTANGIAIVSGLDGVKTLTNIQYLVFSDKQVILSR